VTPFLQFRLWLARATAGSKAGTAVGGALVFALLAWIAIPSNSTSDRAGVSTRGRTTTPSSSSAAPADGGAPAGGIGTGAATPGAGGAPGGSGSGSGAATPGAGAATPTAGEAATDQPTDASGGAAACQGDEETIKVGVVLIEIGSGGANLNSTFGIPSASEQQADWNAVFDAVNKTGGAACHPLEGFFQTYNELDSSTSQAACLEFTQAQVFAVLGGFLPTASDVCPLQNHLPVFEETVIPRADAEQHSPYYFGPSGAIEVVYNNFAHAMAGMGEFDAAKGFKKLGILYNDCIAGVHDVMIASLKSAGLANGQLSNFNLGCPAGFSSPSVLQQAIIQFRRDGVTHLATDASADLQNFTKLAQSQGFRPQYLIPDNGIVATSGNAAFAPDPANFDGAIAITASQYGAIASGLPESEATLACDQVMIDHQLPKVYDSGVQFAGGVCNVVWTLVAAMVHAPTLSPDALADGLNAAGSIDYSFPYGPNDFTAPGTTWGGQFWRPLSYSASCACWMVTDPNFQPSF
jgi:hypothetical protein